MSDKVVIYGFETSNNFKVRIGLAYKGIPFEFKTIDPADREEIYRLSGQPFTPVLVHGDVVMFDSSAILRYVDANFPGTLRLYEGDYGTMREIEGWESFARTELHEPLAIAVKQRLAGTHDEAELARAGALFGEASAKLEERLVDREWLVGDQLTAADVTAGAVVHRVRGLDAIPKTDDRPHTYAWSERVMALDPGA